MEQDRKVKIISLVAVIVAVIGLTLAFAAMSRTLKINGSANTDPVNWEIYFDNLSSPNEVGEGVATNTPTLATKGASITNMNVTLKKPGDSVTYTVDIVNNGDVDAEISNITLPTFTSRQQELLDFKVVYTGTNNSPAQGDMLASKETKNITITFSYKDITDESKLPNSPEAISVDYSIEYVQSNNKVTTTQAGSNYGEEIASKQISENITATYYGGTPMAKANTGVQPMSYDNRVADDVRYEGGTLVISGSGTTGSGDDDWGLSSINLFLADVSTYSELLDLYDSDLGYSYKYNPTNLIIEEGITEIGESYLSHIKSVTNLLLPSSLRTIGPGGLSDLSLTSLLIPNGVETIGGDAFSGAKTLSEVIIPSSVKLIGGCAFYDIASNSTIYCETQAVANLLIDHSNYRSSTTQVIVDPTKF